MREQRLPVSKFIRFSVPHFRYSREILEERKKSKRRRKRGRKSRASALPELIDLADSDISSEEEDGEDSGGEKSVHQGCDSRRKAGFKIGFPHSPLNVQIHATSLHKVAYEVHASAKRWSPGLVNFVTDLAYHFCLALPAAFTQPGEHLLADPCI